MGDMTCGDCCFLDWSSYACNLDADYKSVRNLYRRCIRNKRRKERLCEQLGITVKQYRRVAEALPERKGDGEMLSKERLGELHKRFDNDPEDDLSDVFTELDHHDQEMRDIIGIIRRTVEYAVEEGAPYPAIVNRVIACLPEEYR